MILDASAAGGGTLTDVVVDVWRRFADAEPDADFTRIAALVAAAAGQPLETWFSQG